MRYLLDTHTFLWWLDDENKLSSEAKEVIREQKNTIFVSAVSLWEIAIKSKIGKIEVPESPSTAVTACSFTHLNLTHAHTNQLYKLPGLHRDPFDRMLIAQAKIEDCIVITRDKIIPTYSIRTIVA